MLNDQEKSDLITYIFEDFGSDLDREEFIDRCLQLFEDISGFECLNDKQIQSITTQLWSIYAKR